MVQILCVHGPRPDPWLSTWALIWTSCVHEDPICICSYPFLGQWFRYGHLMDWMAVPLLFLSDWFTSIMGRASSMLPPCLSVQISESFICCIACWGSASIVCHVVTSSSAYVQVHEVIRVECRHAVALLWLAPVCSLAMLLGTDRNPVAFIKIVLNFMILCEILLDMKYIMKSIMKSGGFDMNFFWISWKLVKSCWI